MGLSLPASDKWILIVNKKTGEWGIQYKYEKDEMARLEMKVATLPNAIENFTIAYERTGNGCTLQMDWETTHAFVDLIAK